MLPVVISSLVIKLNSPMRIVDTSQAGLKLLGWKSEIERHNLVEVWKRPEGVIMRMAGGLNG
jgi:PAS domain-containing protein